jgi:hypothetical protein
MDITKSALVLAAVIFAGSAASAQTQTETNTTCTTMPDGSRINCTSTSTTSKPPSSGAAQGIADALNKNRKPVDYDAIRERRNAKVEFQFAQAKSNIADIRANYAQHQRSGTPFPKEPLKAFNHYRKEACKWGKWLRNPVPMDSLVSDLDGTPRTCAEAKQFK